MKHAVQALAEAKQAEAPAFAAAEYARARATFAGAMQEWEFQNQRHFIYRNYRSARAQARKTVLLCHEAGLKAQQTKDSLTRSVQTRLTMLQSGIRYFEHYYKNLPLSHATFDAYSRAKLQYREAGDSFLRGKIREASKLSAEAGNLMDQASAKARLLLESYFRDYPLWQKNARLARKLSAQGQTVLLIDKLAATCSVLRGGKIAEIFPAEFGRHWTGDKIRKGDKATPEGVYRIIKKRHPGSTRYYKSLLLDYPNAEDQARFAALKRSGLLPRNASIGGGIEIHGEGGKGVSWTDGCIALANADMDRIFRYCNVATPVIIIGSARSLNEYLK